MDLVATVCLLVLVVSCPGDGDGCQNYRRGLCAVGARDGICALSSVMVSENFYRHIPNYNKSVTLYLAFLGG